MIEFNFSNNLIIGFSFTCTANFCCHLKIILINPKRKIILHLESQKYFIFAGVNSARSIHDRDTNFRKYSFQIHSQGSQGAHEQFT